MRRESKASSRAGAQAGSMLAAFAAIAACAACAQASEREGRALPRSAPPELRQFIQLGETLVAHHHADLNGDGRRDFLFVVEHARRGGINDSNDEGMRSARIAVRLEDGSLALRASSGKAVLCRACGGMMGDPFAGIDIGKTGFTIRHYGGSSWRWSADFRFAYSRRDDAWQLVMVREESFHASEPDKPTVRTYRPPRDFGKIDFTAFDPEHFKGRGRK